jgi:hypothetical protein
MNQSATAHFLVAHRQKNDVALERHLLSLDHDHGHKLRQAFVLHVLRSAAVHGAFDNFSAERRNFPMRWVAGDHIHVVQKNEGTLSSACGMRQTGPQIGATRRILEDLVLDAFLVENLFEKRRGSQLIAGRVSSIQAQVLLHPLDGKIGILLHPRRRNGIGGELG